MTIRPCYTSHNYNRTGCGRKVHLVEESAMGTFCSAEKRNPHLLYNEGEIIEDPAGYIACDADKDLCQTCKRLVLQKMEES